MPVAAHDSITPSRGFLRRAIHDAAHTTTANIIMYCISMLIFYLRKYNKNFSKKYFFYQPNLINLHQIKIILRIHKTQWKKI